MEYIPYAYLVGWSAHDLWYYGIQYGSSRKIANPQNLWTVYFTSSKRVKEQRELLGEPDVVQIRKTFSSSEAALIWEEKVLRRLGVLKSSKWLNNCYGGKKFRNSSGSAHVFYGRKRPEHSKAMSGQNNPFYGKRFIGENNPFYGKSHTKTTRTKLRNSSSRSHIERMGQEKAAAFRKAHSDFMISNNPFKGQRHTPETKKRLSEAAASMPLEIRQQAAAKIKYVDCPHCGKRCDKRNASRWHFEKCKSLR